MHSSFTLFLWFLFFSFLALFSTSVSVPFFPENNVTLFGDAFFKNNSISLTQEFNCFSPSSSATTAFGFGRAFYFHTIRFLDLLTKTPASFSSHFSFTIVPSPSCPFGDGFAFLITSNAGSIGISDGYMGLPEKTSNMQDSYVAVEFDTSFDPSLGDINDNHIGVDVNTIVSSTSVDAFKKGIDLKSGRQMTAWVDYRNSEKIIQVWVGYSEIRPASPLLVASVDLSRQFKEYMHVGFSASNGNGSAVHIIDRWRFKTFGLLSSTLPMDTMEDGGCIICYPGDPTAEDVLDDNLRKNRRELELGLGFGAAAAFIISVIVIVTLIFICMMRKRHRRGNEGQMVRFQSNRVPRRLSLSEIRSATKGFNENRIIGEGASATVYEGSLSSCGPVAIKRFFQVNHPPTFRNQFATEFATMVGCLRHKNLIQLQGWCCEKNELILVYEYMPNGSLDKILHRRTNATKHLTWERRLNIVLGVCSALIYLHEECEQQIIHRDVKTCNIMLDAEFNAKLGDFGLAEVYEHSSLSREATLPAGTMGYLAPEYVYTGIPTVKVDVYSFGVVVLEAAAGRRPVDDEGIPVTDWVWDLWEKGSLLDAADAKLKGCFNKMDMERMLMVGLSCVHPNHDKRPTMKEAARMLKGEAPLPILPKRKPTPWIQSSLPAGYAHKLNFSEDFNQSLFEDLDYTPWSTPETHFSKH